MSIVKKDIAEDPNDWVTRTASNGLQYYYNMKTKQSTWEKPESLKTDDEKIENCDWHEYTTSDGKTFYYNKILKKSVWKMPPEMLALKQKNIEQRKQQLTDQKLKNGSGKITFSLSSQIKSDEVKDFSSTNQEKQEISKEQSVDIFMQLLKEKGVTPNMKWDQAYKLISNDDRYNIIKAISEKKRVFNDYAIKMRREERQEVKNKQELAKEAFFEMLKQTGLTSDTKMYKVMGQFNSDARWKAISDDRDRESLFQDYLDVVYSQEKDQMRQKRKENSEQMREKIKNHEKFHSNMKYDEFKELFKDDPLFKEMSEYDQLTCFSDLIIDTEQQEADNRKMAKRKKERLNREAFRELLKEYTSKNILTYKTNWKNFLFRIKQDNRFINMLGQNGSTPHELFEDYIEFLKDEHSRTKQLIKALLKKVNLNITNELSYKDFNEALSSQEEYVKLLDNYKSFYYNYIIEKAKSKEKETSKKLRKAIKKMRKFLKTQRDLNSDSSYVFFKQIIEQNSQNFAILNEEQRNQCFQEYIQELKAAELQTQKQYEQFIDNIPDKTEVRLEQESNQSQDEQNKKEKKIKSNKKSQNKKDDKEPIVDNEIDDDKKKKSKKEKKKKKQKENNLEELEKEPEKKVKTDQQFDSSKEYQFQGQETQKSQDEPQVKEQRLSVEKKNNIQEEFEEGLIEEGELEKKKSRKEKKKKGEKSEKKTHKKNKKEKSLKKETNSSGEE